MFLGEQIMDAWGVPAVPRDEVKLKKLNVVGFLKTFFKILILHFGKFFNITKQTIFSSRFAR